MRKELDRTIFFPYRCIRVHNLRLNIPCYLNTRRKGRVMSLLTRCLHVFAIGLMLFCLCVAPKKAFAYEPDSDGHSAKVGFDIRRMHDRQGNPFWSGSIPTLTGGYPILRRYLQVELCWRMEWGFTKFYLDHFPDFLPSLGLRFYPWGKTLSFYGNGGWGTFLYQQQYPYR
jgi:hypothetical protein